MMMWYCDWTTDTYIIWTHTTSLWSDWQQIQKNEERKHRQTLTGNWTDTEVKELVAAKAEAAQQLANVSA